MSIIDDLQKKEKALQNLIRLGSLTVLPLHADFNHASSQWRRDRSSQFWARTTIRCLCAAIEATLFSFRKIVEDIAPLSSVQFSTDEIEILSEKRTVVQGGIRTKRPKFLPPAGAVKETFRLFAKAVGTVATVDYGSGFSDFCGTFEVRNRLMHPKTPFDVAVEPKDINMADRGITWFNQTYMKVADQCEAHLAKVIAEQHTECVTNPLTRQQLFLRKFSLSPELEPLIPTFFRAFSSVRFDRFCAFSPLL